MNEVCYVVLQAPVRKESTCQVQSDDKLIAQKSHLQLIRSDLRHSMRHSTATTDRTSLVLGPNQTTCRMLEDILKRFMLDVSGV